MGPLRQITMGRWSPRPDPYGRETTLMLPQHAVLYKTPSWDRTGLSWLQQVVVLCFPSMKKSRSETWQQSELWHAHIRVDVCKARKRWKAAANTRTSTNVWLNGCEMVNVSLVEKDQVMVIMLNAWQLLCCHSGETVRGVTCPCYSGHVRRACLYLHKRRGPRPQFPLGWIFFAFTWTEGLFTEISHHNLAHDGANSLNSTLTHNNLIIFLLTPHPWVVLGY